MGRYSSVQSYGDNNAAVRSIPYDQATGSKEVKTGKVVSEKVSNPYGSTAGAGSGEFHIYRHARAKEMERWKNIDAADSKIKAEQEFQQSLHQAQTEQGKKTDKNRRKRQREKEAKMRKKNLKAAGIDITKTTAPAQSSAKSATADEDEFTYIPLEEQEKTEAKEAEEKETEEEGGKDAKKPADDTEVAPAVAIEEIPNDGSFLEMMKKRLEAEGASLKKFPAAVAKTVKFQNDDEADSTMEPPPRKKMVIESRLIDEDDEGPMLPPPGFQ